MSRQGGKSDTNLFTVSSPKRGRGTKKGQKKEGRAGEKKRWEKVMISFWAAPGVAGVAGDNSRRFWRGSDNYRFFTQEWSGRHRYCLQISQSSERGKNSIWSMVGFVKPGAFGLTDKMQYYQYCVSTGHWLLQPLTKANVALSERQVPNMLKARLEWQHICATTRANTHLIHYSTGLFRKYPYKHVQQTYLKDKSQICWKPALSGTTSVPQHTLWTGLLRKYPYQKAKSQQHVQQTKTGNMFLVAAHLYHNTHFTTQYRPCWKYPYQKAKSRQHVQQPSKRQHASSGTKSVPQHTLHSSTRAFWENTHIALAVDFEVAICFIQASVAAHLCHIKGQHILQACWD